MCLLNPMMFQIMALGGIDIEETVTGVIDENGPFGGIGQDVTNVGNGIIGTLILIGVFIFVACIVIGALMLGTGGFRSEGKGRILAALLACVIAGSATWLVAKSMGIGSGFNQKGSGTDTKTITAPMNQY